MRRYRNQTLIGSIDRQTCFLLTRGRMLKLPDEDWRPGSGADDNKKREALVDADLARCSGKYMTCDLERVFRALQSLLRGL
jgi:hypothetical protein